MDGWGADLDAPAAEVPPVLRRPRRVLLAVAVLGGAGVLATVGAVALDAAQPGCAELLRGPAGREYARSLGGPADRDGQGRRDAAEVARVCGASVPPGLAVTALVVDAGDPRWLVARTSLDNTTPMALSVTAVDVADVDTVAMADRAVLPPGGRGVLLVRVPVRTCTHDGAPAAPRRWAWSVGPAGDDPAAIVGTALPAGAREALEAAVRERCGPAPAVAARVLGATVVPDAGPVDPRARSVRLTLEVVSRARATVVLGDPPRALTADARPRFSTGTAPPGGPTTVEVVWRTRCGADPVTALPASARLDGVDHLWSVPVDGTPAVRALARSCR